MRFYVMSQDFSRFAHLEHVGKSYWAPPPKCGTCREDLRPMLRIPPYHCRLTSGELGDFATDRMTFAVSSRLVEAYRRSKCSGLTFCEKAIESNYLDLAYYVASPACTQTLLDEAASGVVIDELRGCDDCRVMSLKRIDKVVLKERTWAGQDVFMMGSLFSAVVVTERFVDFVDLNGFSNFSFVPQDDYQKEYLP